MVTRGILSGEMDEFIAYKHSLGRRYAVEEKTLALLDDYLVAREENSSC